MALPGLADAATGPAVTANTSRPGDAPKTVEVTNTDDSGAGSLRAAIAEVAAGGTITFASTVSGAIELDSSLVVTRPMKIVGPGRSKLIVANASTATGSYDFEVFSVKGGDVALSGLTMSGGAVAVSVDESNVTVFDSTLSYSTEACVEADDHAVATIAASVVTDCGTGIGSAYEGNAVITHSLLYDNGIGVYLGTEAAANVVDSTIVGSTFGLYGDGIGSVVQSTVTGNHYGVVDAGVIASDIIAGNADGDCLGAVSDAGFNLIGATVGRCATTQSSSVTGSDVASYLGTLVYNGGPTRTVAISPVAKDPAFRAVPASAKLPDSTTRVCSGVDQRGVPRTSPCDIGAFEYARPFITASLKSKAKQTKYGWYDRPVTVRFACSDPDATITSCSKPVTLTKQGRADKAVGTAVAKDGQRTTTRVVVNIDLTKPTIKVGKKVTCHDALSGIASCDVKRGKPRNGIVHFTATATDKAGNVRTVHGSYRNS